MFLLLLSTLNGNFSYGMQTLVAKGTFDKKLLALKADRDNPTFELAKPFSNSRAFYTGIGLGALLGGSMSKALGGESTLAISTGVVVGAAFMATLLLRDAQEYRKAYSASNGLDHRVAAFENNQEGLKALNNFKHDPIDQRDEYGATPIHYAIKGSAYEATQFLLDAMKKENNGVNLPLLLELQAYAKLNKRDNISQLLDDVMYEQTGNKSQVEITQVRPQTTTVKTIKVKTENKE